MLPLVQKSTHHLETAVLILLPEVTLITVIFRCSIVQINFIHVNIKVALYSELLWLQWLFLT